MNEPDAYALEEALRLKEKHGGEVVVCSAGPARVAQVHPRGAGPRRRPRHPRRGRRRWRAPTRSSIADALAGAMRDERVRPRPHRPAVRRPGLRPDRRRPRRAARAAARDDHHGGAGRTGADAAREARARGRLVPVGAMPLPAVLTIQSGINQLRYATLKGIMAAKKKEIRKASAARRLAAAPEDRQPLRAREVQEDADDRRLAGRGREGARAPAARGGAGHLAAGSSREASTTELMSCDLTA